MKQSIIYTILIVIFLFTSCNYTMFEHRGYESSFILLNKFKKKYYTYNTLSRGYPDHGYYVKKGDTIFLTSYTSKDIYNIEASKQPEAEDRTINVSFIDIPPNCSLYEFYIEFKKPLATIALMDEKNNEVLELKIKSDSTFTISKTITFKSMEVRGGEFCDKYCSIFSSCYYYINDTTQNYFNIKIKPELEGCAFVVNKKYIFVGKDSLKDGNSNIDNFLIKNDRDIYKLKKRIIKTAKSEDFNYLN